MKNFKKVLALVLAVACLLSFAAVASANNAIRTSEVYDDAKSISADYTEALDVLTAIGVLDGKGANSFKPQDTLKRSEAAKIIAVFANTDTEINSLYASANPFTDVAANHWAVSYIAYCYKTGIIAGVKDGVFAPDARLTGIQFLKMVLCTLGYDAHEEGLVGTSWKVNTLQLAKNVGLTAVLGNSFNYDAELSREAAAQIMLNALNANTVSYGTAIKTASTMLAYETVAGAVANSEFLYQKWGLRKITATTDDFGRPAHKWLLKNVDFGKIYTDAPLASYTVKVAGCQILTDAIFDTTNPAGTKTLRVWENGVQKGTEVVADTTELRYGAQGRLTEVFEDRIVYIDTFLGQILNVVPGRTDAQGHIIRAAFVTAKIWHPTLGEITTTFETEGFVKDQFVRVTGVVGGDQAGVANRGITVKTMDAVETKQGIFNGYTGYINNNNIPTQVKLGEEYLNTAEKGLCYNVQGNINGWMGIELVAFMDQYGNILGLDKYWAALNYGVVDALWLGVENGQAVLKADLVTIGGEVLSAVTVASIARPVNGANVTYKATDFFNGVDATTIPYSTTTTAAYADAFLPNYDKLAYFTTNMNGQYEVQLAGADLQFDSVTTDYYKQMRTINEEVQTDNYNTKLTEKQTVEFTAGYAWGYIATTDGGQTTKTAKIPMDANTIILVRGAGTSVPFASRIQGGYTSYTGYAALPSLTAKNVSYHINYQTGYADVVYVSQISVTGTKTTVFAAGDAIQVTGITYDSLNNKYFNYNVTVYVVDEATGALTKGTYTMTEQSDATAPSIVKAPKIGFHTAYINANNEISFGIKDADHPVGANYGPRFEGDTKANEPDANFNGKTYTAKRAAVLGPNAYMIFDGESKVAEIYSNSATTNGYAFDDANQESVIAVVNSVEYDVVDGDKLYVYQNNNNPANPIYCVVDEFKTATVQVEVGEFDEHGIWQTTEAARDVVDNDPIITSYSVGFKGRTWEAAYAVAAPGYTIEFMTNNGVKCTKNAYGYWYDNSANATVGDVVIYVSNTVTGGAALNTVSGGLVQVRNGGMFSSNLEIVVNGSTNVGNLLAELERTDVYGNFIYKTAQSANATIAVYKNVIGTNPVLADNLDPVAAGMDVVVTSADGMSQSVYHIVNSFSNGGFMFS